MSILALAPADLALAKPRTIKFFAYVKHFNIIAGVSSDFLDYLFDGTTSTAKKIGTETRHCTATSSNGSSAMCTVKIKLAGGTIDATTSAHSSHLATGRLTGGTGKYAGATGTATYRSAGSGTSAHFAVTIKLS